MRHGVPYACIGVVLVPVQLGDQLCNVGTQLLPSQFGDRCKPVSTTDLVPFAAHACGVCLPVEFLHYGQYWQVRLSRTAGKCQQELT